ncbi:hypothetical protein, partial [Ruminococcus callidus]|uniref:hypothetical protein n=1 Tax=Ruminococcus callidus TaxID=40519 RepID=UPI003C6E2243
MSSLFFKKYFFFQKIDKLITANILLAGNNAEFSAGKSQCVDSTFLLNRNQFCPAVDLLFPESTVLFHKCICVKDAVITSEQHAENTRKAAEQKQDTASERIPIRHAVSPNNNAENAKRRKTDKPDASGNTESFRNSHAFPIRIFFVFSVDIFVCPFVKQLRQQCRNGVGKQ